jgi:hypothetical protein
VVAIAVLIALVLLYALAGFVLLPRLGRAAIAQYVEHDLHRKVSIGAFDFNPFTLSLEIRDFRLREADERPLLGFDFLRVRASLSSLPNWATRLSTARAG